MMCRNFHTTSWLFHRHRLIISTTLSLWTAGLIALEHGFTQSPAPPKTSAPTGSVGQNPAKPLLKTGSQGPAVTKLQAMLKLMGYYTGTVNGTFDEATATAVTRFQKAANLSADGVVGLETWNRLLPPSPTVTATPTQPNSAATNPATADSFPIPAGTSGSTTTPAKPGGTASTKPTTAAATTPGSDRPQPTAQDAASFPILRIGMKGPAVEGLQQRLQALGFLKGSVDGVFGAETQAAVKAAQRDLKLEPDGVVGNATWLRLLR